ncbi:MAG: glycosyltransferase family 9 protein [Candidatus Omnitrophica bacterium]|nr:glycosyltransferase family 9 protein [Candidatus Omnitrophota bacterium]
MRHKIIWPVIRKILYLLCTAILKGLSYLFFWIGLKTPDLKNVHRILLIKTERIGDLVLSTPAIRAIKQNFPRASVSIIINSYTKAIVENDPHLDEIIVYDVKGAHKSLIEKIRFIKDLRKKKFDIAVDLNTRPFFFLPVWLLCLSAAKITLGLDNFGRGLFYNIKVKPRRKPRPLTEEVLHILSPLGISTPDRQLRLFLREEDKVYIQKYLNEKGVRKNDLVVGIHPGGYYETLRWVEDGYAKVTQHLIKERKAKVFFVGNRKERDLVDRITALTNGGPINLAGKITLGQLMAIISRCNLFIGNSSGPLNIALGFGISTISFLGPSIPERWRPSGEKNIVFRKDLPCSPCESGYCRRRDFACMKKIKPEEVIEAVNRQLEKR